jgi:hypothetical protein
MFTDTLNKVSQGCITHTPLRMIPVIEFLVKCLFRYLGFITFGFESEIWHVQ